MRQTFATVALLALALVACQQGTNDNIAIDESNSLNADVETLPPDESVADESNASGNAAMPVPPNPVTADIPTEYHGRWGMVAADCTSTRGDAKGLIDIGDQTIKFYEAIATLKERRPAIATSFSGMFAFTGEGQSWEKVMTFTRTGDMLERAEQDGRFTYKKC